jgi:hypothetical protein
MLSAEAALPTLSTLAQLSTDHLLAERRKFIAYFSAKLHPLRFQAVHPDRQFFEHGHPRLDSFQPVFDDLRPHMPFSLRAIACVRQSRSRKSRRRSSCRVAGRR